MDRRSYLEAKFGGPARAAQIYERVREAGRSAGIAFDFDAIARQPNTRDAHRLIAWAQASGDAGALVEKLFAAYFLEGAFVGDRARLAELAGAAGLDAAAARAWLDAGTGPRRSVTPRSVPASSASPASRSSSSTAAWGSPARIRPRRCAKRSAGADESLIRHARGTASARIAAAVCVSTRGFS